MSKMTKKIKKNTKLFAYIENKQYLCSVKRVKNDILLQKKQGICLVKSWFSHNLYSHDHVRKNLLFYNINYTKCMSNSEKTEFLFKMPGVRLQLVKIENATFPYQVRKNRRILTNQSFHEDAVRFFKGQVYQLCMQSELFN